MRKKILIIAPAHSTHTHAWIDLIDTKKFEVRLFGLQGSCPGIKNDWYLYTFRQNYPFINQRGNPLSWLNILRKISFFYDRRKDYFLEKKWLCNIIKNWQPNIIHSLGIEATGKYFLTCQKKLYDKNYRWIVTIRGGSDIELARFNIKKKKILHQIFKNCDYVFADNSMTYSYAFDLGLEPNKKPPINFVPGTGGIDITKISRLRKNKTSQSRIILWPKAYDGDYSKGLPILEAIKNAWSKIIPCQVVITTTDTTFLEWIDALPYKIRQCIKIYGRIPRKEFFKLMAIARVVLLPSMIDGIPNSLYEAMACKTFPIVSPLKTVTTVVNHKNVLFARNLYPNEIEIALKKAMNDDAMIDKVVDNNLFLVRQVANRKKITTQVNEFYERIL